MGAAPVALARPDLFITDAERVNVIGSRRKDRDSALIGIRVLLDCPILRSNLTSRYYHYNTFFPVMQARAF